MSGAFDFFGLSITYGRLWIIVFTLVVFFALLLALKATPLGLQMRAVTQNRRMASSMGIRTGRIDAMTFALGSGIAGIAGVALVADRQRLAQSGSELHHRQLHGRRLRRRRQSLGHAVRSLRARRCQQVSGAVWPARCSARS